MSTSAAHRKRPVSKALRTQTPVEPAEVLEPQVEMPSEQPTLLHPAAGGLILGLDWLLFSGTVVTAAVALPASVVAGFALGSVGTAIIQRKLGGDSRRKAILKGLAAGVVVGMPFPVAGTAVGGGVLMLSGLDRLLKRKLNRTASS